MAEKRPSFKVGDLVLMKDGHIPRGQWPEALVEETLPDSDEKTFPFRFSDGNKLHDKIRSRTGLQFLIQYNLIDRKTPQHYKVNYFIKQ